MVRFALHPRDMVPVFYQLSKNAFLEKFDDGILALVLPDRRLVELMPTAVEIMGLLDGRNVPDDVAAEMVKNHDILLPQATQNVLEVCQELERAGVLEVRPDFQSEKKAYMESDVLRQFLRNPDVIIREEEPDEGALLFNPDTNQVKFINTTGLFIWQQCGVARTLDEIVAKVRKDFEDTPLEQVVQDVQEFVDGMLIGGFIGTIETTG